MIFMMVAGFSGSVVKFRGDLIDALLARGIEVHVAAPGISDDSDLVEYLSHRRVVAHDIPLNRTGINPVGDLFLLWSLFRLMRRVRPDLVFGYTIKPVIYGSLAAWLARVPNRYALITGLGYAFQGDGQRRAVRALVQRCYALALASVRKVFFQNPDDQALFRERGILTSRTPSLVVNGSGVNVAAYTVAPIRSESSRFLMIGRLLGDKGVREYAQAARQVRTTHSEVHFALVGWIDENPDAIGQAELDEWIADGTVDFLGRLNDVRPAIADCSVYVLPSYREGTPRTVLEAMAMGRPIITTDAPGCRETVVDGDNGFLVPVKSIDALAAAMRRFIETPGLVTRMGQRSRKIAEDRYDVHKVNEVMLHEMGIVDQGKSRVMQHD